MAHPSVRETWLWWSSGKDSAWALEMLRRDPMVEVTRLVTTVTAKFDRVAMHAVRTELLRAQAKAVGLELTVTELPYPCPNERYEEAALAVIRGAEAQGVAQMAFGDLYLEDVRAYRERLLTSSSISASFPLWGTDTRALAHEMIDAGIRATLTCVDPNVLPKQFAGRRFDRALLNDLPKGVDPCGENGEFHTFVYDGPMFSKALQITVGPCVERDGFVFADVQNST